MPRIRTHYDNLKVARDAPVEVIEAAHRALLQKYRSEKVSSTDSVRIVGLINEAHKILSDPERRAQHDEWIRHAEEDSSARAGIRSRVLSNVTGIARRHATTLKVIAAVVVAGTWLSYQWSIRPATVPAPLATAHHVVDTALPPTSFGVPESSILQRIPISIAAPPTGAAPSATVSATPVTRPKECPREVPQLPVSGVVKTRYENRRDLPVLKITSSTSSNAYVKVFASTGEDVAHLFVRRNESVQVHLADGDYSIRYVTGDHWYGESLLFCPQRWATQGQDPLTLSSVARPGGIALHGQEVTLTQEIGGNFASYPISADDF